MYVVGCPCPNGFCDELVAGRGGGSRVQDRVRAVPGGCRESGLRVCTARGGGAWACAGRTRTVL